jgi:hypothetical protein
MEEIRRRPAARARRLRRTRRSGKRRLSHLFSGHVLTLDSWLEEHRVPEDKHAGRADEPEERAKRGGDPEERNADHEETGIERFLGDLCPGDVERLSTCAHKLD